MSERGRVLCGFLPFTPHIQFVGSVAIAPVDLIKVRVQLKTEMGDKRVKPSDVIRCVEHGRCHVQLVLIDSDVLRQEGPTGFYQGYGSVLLRESTQMGTKIDCVSGTPSLIPRCILFGV